MRKRRKRSLLKRLLFWYPGGIWARRFAHMAIMYSIGLNLYVNFIQTELFIESECIIEEAEATISKYDSISRATVGVIRELNQYIGWSATDFWSSLDYYLISNQNNKTVQQVEKHRAIVTEYSDRLKQYGSVYAAISALLKIITWLFWIRVALSLIWICGDLMYGNVRRLMTFFLLFAVGFDVLIYQYLTEHYPLYVLPETLVNGFFSTMDFLDRILRTLPI